MVKTVGKRTKIFSLVHVNEFMYMIDQSISTNKFPKTWVSGEDSQLRVLKSLVFSGSSQVYGNPILASNDPSLSDLPKLPSIEEGVHKESYDACDEFHKNEGKNQYDLTKEEFAILNEGFVWGFTKAASKKKYTIQDIKEALRNGVHIGMQNVKEPIFIGDGFNFDQAKAIKECVEYIDKLKPSPIKIEVEMEYDDTRRSLDISDDYLLESAYSLKLVDNHVVVTEWHY